MTLYVDLNNVIHDDMDGMAKHLLPIDCVEITEKEVEKIRISQMPVVDPQDAINAEALAYLASTDWYVLRLSETSTAIPADILTKRQAARDSIK